MMDIFLITKTGPEWQVPIEAWTVKKMADARLAELDGGLNKKDTIDRLSNHRVHKIQLKGPLYPDRHPQGRRRVASDGTNTNIGTTAGRIASVAGSTRCDPARMDEAAKYGHNAAEREAREHASQTAIAAVRALDSEQAVSDDFRQMDLDAIARYTHPPEAARDAVRLNFLLAKNAVVETDGSNNWRVKRGWMPDVPEAYGPYATSMRAAIDAAMKVNP